ncbi:4-methylaminobutanoate oxidase (formaldehyde-forming) [Candidatus Calditenuaceae archaeon HR02]|nr:4-methylaminobutanoate oxidase (formaldehyde-forming) [Candidatus Calditenuaceae archaeon HR02]
MRHEELVVVGGGIVGCFTAYFAAEKGFRVALVEAGHLGSGSSGKSAGIHTTQLVLPIDIQLSKRSQEIYRNVATESVSKVGFLSIEPYWMSKYSKKLLDGADVRYRVLSNGELADWVRWMRIRDYEVGLYTPDDIVVDVSGLFSILRERLSGLGVRVYEWWQITNLDAGQRVINLERDRLSFDYAVLAGGAWNRDLLAKSGVWRVPTLVYACQVLSFNVDGNVFDVPVFIEENHVYMRRFGQSSLLVGNGFALKLKSPSDCPPHPVREFIDELGQKLLDRLKHPENYRLTGGWTGVCSSTPDGRPLVGQVPGNPYLFIIDGLDGYGIMRGPALSQDLIEYISTGKAPATIEAFTPARFTNFAGEPEEVIELHSWL